MDDPLLPHSARRVLRIAACLGAAAVLLGAFGAHGLRERLSAEMLTIFEVGVRYHFYHALALLAIGLAPATVWKTYRLAQAAWAWCFGILVFSGSLYLLAITGLRWLGASTPIGGVALVAGWVLLLFPRRREP